MKLLIVDDSMIVRNAIERNVRNAEITEMLQADNGVRALEIYFQQFPELVTMDLTMPHLDGLGCLQQIQEGGHDASILVISALNSHRSAMEAVERGACGFLVKPFTPQELAEAINDLVAHAREKGSAHAT
jgi:two-component system chemotaxis response regulator CheY